MRFPGLAMGHPRPTQHGELFLVCATIAPKGTPAMRELIGRTLGHYRIVEKIGEGGMGQVYRALDERLDRDVAIKILPAEVADDPDRLGRFEREAKALAQLTHPNILQIFEFGEDQGVTFAVTELLEGESLRERIALGPLPWRKAVEITASAADGLSTHMGRVPVRDSAVVAPPRFAQPTSNPTARVDDVCLSV